MLGWVSQRYPVDMSSKGIRSQLGREQDAAAKLNLDLGARHTTVVLYKTKQNKKNQISLFVSERLFSTD